MHRHHSFLFYLDQFAPQRSSSDIDGGALGCLGRLACGGWAAETGTGEAALELIERDVALALAMASGGG